MSIIITKYKGTFSDINRVRAIYKDNTLKPNKELTLAEGEEVIIEIRKSKVDKLAGLLGDINIDSVELQHSTKERVEYKSRGTMEGKYHPSEKVSDEELEEISQLKEKSLKGEYVKWSELKKELSG